MNLFKFFCPVLLGALVSCAGRSDWRKDASNLIGEGRFSQLDSLLEEAEPGASEQELRAIDSLREVMRRLRIEFCYNEEQILSPDPAAGVRYGISGADPSMGKVREVGDAADRQPEALLQPFGRQPDSAGPGTGRIAADRLVGDRFSGKARRAGDCSDRFAGNCTNPVTMTIRYTLVVEPDAVPEGDTIRCWLPIRRKVCRARPVSN